MSCNHFVQSNVEFVDGEHVYPCELCFLLSEKACVDAYIKEDGKFEFPYRFVNSEDTEVIRFVNIANVQNIISKLLSKFVDLPHIRTAILQQIQVLLSLPTKPKYITKTRDDMFATFHSQRYGILGCQEYIRGCHMQCPDCKVVYVMIE